MALTTAKSAYVADTALPAPVIAPELVDVLRRVPGALLLCAQVLLVYGEADRLLGPTHERNAR